MRTNWKDGPKEPAPGLDCLGEGHIFIDWQASGDFAVWDGADPNRTARACWCLWCGTASYDSDLDVDRTPT